MLMKKRSYNYEKLSEITGYDRATLWRIIRGKTINPRLETVKTIASALGVRVEDIILQDY